MPSLLNLPRELRDQIYSLLVTQSEPIMPLPVSLSLKEHTHHVLTSHENTKMRPSRLNDVIYDPIYPTMAMLGVNHQIKAEAEQIFWRSNTWHMSERSLSQEPWTGAKTCMMRRVILNTYLSPRPGHLYFDLSRHFVHHIGPIGPQVPLSQMMQHYSDELDKLIEQRACIWKEQLDIVRQMPLLRTLEIRFEALSCPADYRRRCLDSLAGLVGQLAGLYINPEAEQDWENTDFIVSLLISATVKGPNGSVVPVLIKGFRNTMETDQFMEIANGQRKAPYSSCL